MHTIIYDAEQIRYGVRIGRRQKRKWSELDDRITSIANRYKEYSSAHDYLLDLSNLIASVVRQN